ncbi:MAG: Gfo/Idh/MocA family oxidoreductase [Anaerolineae bacterium]
MTVRVGLIGTSWWADFMYLSPLKEHRHCTVVAVCGRNAENSQKLADKWGVPLVFTDYNALIDSGEVDALMVVTPNVSHYPITMKALGAGLHVLCEKPLAMNYQQAREMAELAEQKGVKTFVPFTWSFMPYARYLKELIANGYLGKPYHCNLRYYSGYSRDNASQYVWRMDVAQAGSGALGDLGSHFTHLAYWLFGDITSVCSHLGQIGEHAPLDPSGQAYELADDTAVLTLTFDNGAQGSVHVTTLAYAGASPIGTTFHMDFHGSDGTLSGLSDFETRQHISGAKPGEPIHDLPIPDSIWAGANRDSVMETIGDVYGKQEFMAREWVTAIAEDKPLRPDFREGAAIQRVIDAAIKSHQERRWVDIEEIQ